MTQTSRPAEPDAIQSLTAQRSAPRRRKKKKNKRTRLLQRRLLALGACAAVFLTVFSLGASWRAGRGAKITEETVIDQLKTLPALSATSYHFTSIERFENIEDFYGWNASDHANFTLSYEGTVSAAVDPSQAKVQIKGKSISITLPEAKITSEAIEKDSISVYNSKQGKFEPIELIDFTGFEDNQKTVAQAKATAGGLLIDASGKAKTAAKALVDSLTGGSSKYEVSVK